MVQNPEFKIPSDFLNSTQPLSLIDIENVLQAIPAGVMLITPEGLIWYINSTGKQMLGLEKDESCLAEQSSTYFRKPAGVTEVDDFIHTTFPRIEFTLTSRTGKEIPVIKSSSSITIGNQKFFLETFIDISERKKKLADLNESRRQIGRASCRERV